MIKIRNSLAEIREKERRSNFRFIAWILILALVLYTSAVILTQCFVTIRVSGDSMNTTLSSGDVLVVNSYSSPKRGDIVIIDKGEYLVVKRVIGMGGDVIKIFGGHVYRNGKRLIESYTLGSTYRDCEITLKKGEIFYLGDNRENSTDSRDSGPCKESDVIGVVLPRNSVFTKVIVFFSNLIY